MKDWLKPREVGAILYWASKSTIDKWRQSGALRAARMPGGKAFRYLLDDVRRLEREMREAMEKGASDVR